MTASYKEAIDRLLAGRDLSREGARSVMEDAMRGLLTDIQLGALLTALAVKGETADELVGFASVMREKALRVVVEGDLLDTCGTGGSGLPTANTSTMSAFVLAAAGIKVAKHGNRKSSGRCGSADLLELLGVRIEIGPERAAQLLDEHDLAFMLAPLYHPAVRHVVPVRKGLGFRTVFNFLGPLCNPAGTRFQVLGVSDPSRAALMAGALAEMGTERALLLWGEDGLDELTLTGPTRIWDVRGGEVRESRFEPAMAGLEQVGFEAIAGGGPEDNLRIFHEVLSGRETGPRAQHLLLNAAAGFVVTGRAETLAEGVEQARAQVDSGAAYARFEAYRDATRRGRDDA